MGRIIVTSPTGSTNLHVGHLKMALSYIKLLTQSVFCVTTLVPAQLPWNPKGVETCPKTVKMASVDCLLSHEVEDW